MMKKIDIIIVNWNSGNLISECIESINLALNNSFKISNIVIVDNDSTDNSIDLIQDNKLPITIIKSDVNLGFAKACNLGAKKCTSDFLLMLNPDTKLFSDSLDKPIKFLSDFKNNAIGILGVKQINENGEIQKKCARFPTAYDFIYRALGLDRIFPSIFNPHYMKEFNHDSSMTVDQVMGSYYLIRTDLFKRLNGYDESFFVYYEDLDLAYRAKLLGYDSFYFAESKIFHKGAGTTEKIKSYSLFLNLQSRLIFIRKHYSEFYYRILSLFILFVEPITRFIYSLIFKNKKEAFQVLKGHYMLIKDGF